MRIIYIIFRQTVLRARKIIFLYLAAFLAAVPLVFMAARWAPELEQSMVEGMFNVFMLLLLLVIYHYANSLIAEEKDGGVLSEYLTAPVRLWELILGRVVGVVVGGIISGATALICIVAGLVILGVPVVFPFGVYDACGLVSAAGILMLAYGLFLVTGALMSRDRRFVNIALILLPCLQYVVHGCVRGLRLRHWGYEYFRMTWTVEYIVVAVIMLFLGVLCTFLCNSKQKISIAETAPG